MDEYLERWLRDYAAVNVAPSTHARYRQIARRLSPLIGSVRLQALRPAQLQAAYSALLADDLAERTVNHHDRMLRTALHHAVRWQLVPRNVADAATPARPQRTEMRVLDADGFHRLLDACDDDQLRTVVCTAVTTGMRVGELFGLRWSDIDFATGTVQVTRAAQYLPGTGVTFRPTKTHRSRRSIALSDQTLNVLREHRRRQLELRLVLGPGYRDGDLVFASVEGDPLASHWASRRFRRALRRAGLPLMRFHDLRHTAATLMLRAGVHPKVVSERLGHSTIALTLDMYSHVMPDMQREAAVALDALLATGR